MYILSIKEGPEFPAPLFIFYYIVRTEKLHKGGQ